MNRFLACISSVLLTLTLWLPAGRSQAPSPQSNNNPPETDKAEKVPALQYTLVLMFTMLILTIVCMPSRKATLD